MHTPRLEFQLEGVGILDPSLISKFSLQTSINTSYPRGYMVLDDSRGISLMNYSIRPGSILAVSFVDFNIPISSRKVERITPLIVTSVTNNNLDQEYIIPDSRKGALGGPLYVTLTHPSVIINNPNNSAYSGKISAIVKKLVTDLSSKAPFWDVQITPNGTDDSGGVVRYKISENEFEFLANKLLPYAVIGRKPAYAFISERNAFIFKNFAELYSQESKAIIIPPMEEIQSDMIPKTGSAAVLQMVDGVWGVGSKFLDQIDMLKKTVYIEDTSAHAIFKATLPYKSPIPGFVMIKKNLLATANATSIHMYQNRVVEDAVHLAINANKILDEYFQVIIIVPFSADVAYTGVPVDLKLSGQTPNSGPHWLSGKWLITAADHFSESGSYFSKLVLSRPAINPLPKNLDPSSFIGEGEIK